LVLKEKTITNNFYWTGGTVLSEFYLHHRDSEDIDLFTDKEEIRVGPINTMISKFGGILGARKIGYTQYLGLHTFTFYLENEEILKVDFNYYPFTRLEKGGKYGKLVYDSVLDIAVNKIETIAQRSRSRDFIDLYMIVKKYNYSITELMKIARSKFDHYTDPVQLAGKFLMAREVVDLPKMKIDLPDEEWRNFFEDEAMKLKSMAF
jgi:predicted nucleotidyltransferase component of viral defense system